MTKRMVTRPVTPVGVYLLVALIVYVVVLGGILTITGDESVSSYLWNVAVVTASLALGIGGIRVYTAVNGNGVGTGDTHET